MTGVAPVKEHLSTKVVHVGVSKEEFRKSILQTANGQTVSFDQIVLACHGDEALELIQGGKIPVETEILSAFKTTRNTAYLHSDTSVRFFT
jgi:predicted NAD/FAD-binding protein